MFVAAPRGLRADRLPASATAECSAPGHGPALAIDGDPTTMWIASLKASPANNRVWFQLDLGAVRFDLSEAARLALEHPTMEFDIFHIVGTPEADETCNVARSRDVLGLTYKGDLEQYR
jgi:hypothetical protein